MIDIYAMHFKLSDGTIQENRTLIQSVPAANEGDIKLINPKVSQKTGAAESMDFSVQPGTAYYDAFIQMRTYLEVEFDGDLIFYGRVLTIEQGFYGEQKIKMEGAMAFFNDSYFPGEKESDRDEISLGTYITNILTNHNTQLGDAYRAIYPGEIPGHYTAATSAEQRIDEVTRKFGENGWRQTKAALDDLTSHYGGMFRIRHASDGYMYLDWYKHYYRASINSQIIEVGKNLIDASSITEVNNIFTVIIPIGQGETSEDKIYITGTYFPVSRVTEFYTDSELNSGYHLASDYREAESRYGVIIKPQEFTEADTEEKLLAECAKWVKENYQGGVEEFTVSAVDLHQLGDTTVQKILCGDRVRLCYPVGNGQVVERTLTCISASYELYNPESNSYSFGIPASSLSRGYSVNSTKSDQDADTTQDDPPKGQGTHDNRTKYEQWYDGVVNWLTQHRVWKKHNNNQEGGPNSTYEFNMFVHMVGSTGEEEMAEIWVPLSYDIPYSSPNRPSYGFRLDTNGHPMGSWKRVPRRYFYRNKKDYERKYDLTSDRLIEYIFWEHGKDFGATKPENILGGPLDNILNSSVFTEVFDEDGNIMKDLLGKFDLKTIIEDGKTMIKETVGNVFSGVFGQDGSGFNIKALGDGVVDIVNKLKMVKETALSKVNMVFGDLRESGSALFGNFMGFSLTDPETGVDTLISSLNGSGLFFSKAGVETEGDVEFTDDDGNKVSARDLHDITIRVSTDANKLGYIATKYFGDLDNPQIVTYEFTQSIEEYTNGKIVVARVEGDQVILGGQNASSVVTTALNNVSQVCGEFTTETDSVTGERKVKVKNGTGLYLQKNNASFGLYMTPEGETDAVLTGGIMIEKLNDNTVTTHIKGDRVIVGTVDSATAQTMQEKFGDVDGLIAQKATISELNAAKARISTLETDYLKTTNLYSAISNLPFVRAIQVSSAEYLLLGADSQGHETSTSLKNSIKELQIVANGSSGYKLQYKNYSSSDWQDAGTFNRAVSLRGAWSSGVYTVSATAGTISGSAPNTNLKGGLGLGTPAKGTGSTIDVTYDIGYGEVVSGQWRRAGSTGQTGTINLDVSSLLENKGTVTSNGTYTPASGKIGISSIKVNVSDIGNAKSRFGVASGSYYIEAYDNRSGNSIANSSVSYKLGTSGSGSATVVQVQNSSGTKIGAELSLASIYTPETSEIGFDQLTIQPDTASIAGRTKAGSFKKSNLSAPGYLFFRVGCRGTNKLYYITVDP